MSLKPLGNRVLLRKIEGDTRGGITVPRGAEVEESTAQEYEVVGLPNLTDYKLADAVGIAAGNIPERLPIGTRIYLARHKGWKIETRDGDEFYVADVEDILAVEERTPVPVPSANSTAGCDRPNCNYPKDHPVHSACSGNGIDCGGWCLKKFGTQCHTYPESGS